MPSPVGAVETPARRIRGATALGCDGTRYARRAPSPVAHGERTVPPPPPSGTSCPAPSVRAARRSLVRVALRTVRRPRDIRVSLAAHNSTAGWVVYELGAAQRIQLTQLPPLEAAELLALEDATRVVHPANRSLIALGLERCVSSGHARGHQRRHRALWNGDHAELSASRARQACRTSRLWRRWRWAGRRTGPPS